MEIKKYKNQILKKLATTNKQIKNSESTRKQKLIVNY